MSAEYVFYIKRVSQKYPAPTKINSQFEVGIRWETYALFTVVAVASQSVIFIPTAVFQHKRQIIKVGGDESGVDSIELFSYLSDFPPRVTHCSGNTICQIDKNAFTVLRCCILLYLFLCGSIQDMKKEAE